MSMDGKCRDVTPEEPLLESTEDAHLSSLASLKKLRGRKDKALLGLFVAQGEELLARSKTLLEEQWEVDSIAAGSERDVVLLEEVDVRVGVSLDEAEKRRELVRYKEQLALLLSEEQTRSDLLAVLWLRIAKATRVLFTMTDMVIRQAIVDSSQQEWLEVVDRFRHVVHWLELHKVKESEASDRRRLLVSEGIARTRLTDKLQITFLQKPDSSSLRLEAGGYTRIASGSGSTGQMFQGAMSHTGQMAGVNPLTHPNVGSMSYISSSVFTSMAGSFVPPSIYSAHSMVSEKLRILGFEPIHERKELPTPIQEPTECTEPIAESSLLQDSTRPRVEYPVHDNGQQTSVCVDLRECPPAVPPEGVPPPRGVRWDPTEQQWETVYHGSPAALLAWTASLVLVATTFILLLLPVPVGTVAVLVAVTGGCVALSAPWVWTFTFNTTTESLTIRKEHRFAPCCRQKSVVPYNMMHGVHLERHWLGNGRVTVTIVLRDRLLRGCAPSRVAVQTVPTSEGHDWVLFVKEMLQSEPEDDGSESDNSDDDDEDDSIIMEDNVPGAIPL